MSFFASANTTANRSNEKDLINDITVANPPDDSISDLAFSPQAELLSVASWDKKVRIYEISESGQTQGRALYEHDGPVLTTRWTADGTKVISGGVDKMVKLYDIQSGQAQQIGQHDAAVKAVRYVECGPSNTPCVASGSWDKTLKYWDMRTPQAIATVALPERVYCMDSSQKLLVIGCANRNIAIINLNEPQTIFKSMMSPLKWQSRSIACFPQGDGFVIGSIEGRCAIHYIDESEHSKLGFSFKCHRKAHKVDGRPESQIYSINSINFHPIYGSFATASSDGSFNFWDKVNKHRLKGSPYLNSTISATAFNRNGTIFAYAMSYDWSQGHQSNRPDYPNMIKLHATKVEETKPKPKRTTP